MLFKYGRLVAELSAKLVAWLHGIGVTHMLTYTGFIFTGQRFLAGAVLSSGAALSCLAAFFDMLDGSLARATDQSSTFGAFIDSTWTVIPRALPSWRLPITICGRRAAEPNSSYLHHSDRLANGQLYAAR